MLINQIPFFVIENQNLYKEQVLVEYSWYPIFFVCTTDINDHYIVLYAEINDTVKYLIISVPDTELSLMLHGQIPMKDIFLHRECYWEVTAGDDTTKDTVNKKRISDLDEAMLPTGSFEILTKEVSEYVKKLDERIRSPAKKCQGVIKKIRSTSRFSFAVRVYAVPECLSRLYKRLRRP